VIRGELSDRVFEDKQRIVRTNRPARPRTQLLELSEHRSQPLIRLLARLVGGRCEPFEPVRQRRRYDEYVLCRADQLANAERQLLRAGGRGACRYQEPGTQLITFTALA
jgi:hypothetical protein